jgi:DNA polymerase-3 subunit beta|tara:strand:+ start:1968 stop:3074 length:1107 start_codon:yes stop_codon:yes gene_type:complete
MNISTTKKELQQAFSKLSKTTQLKSQNPLVNYTYISSSPAGVLLHSTDLEVGVKTHINASVNSDGECLFPTSEMNDIISVLDEGRVDIEVSGPHINIKSESGVSFDISTVPFQEYPEMPENKHDNLFCIETSSLKEIISSLMYAINSEPTKPALNGACFNFLDDSVDFIATDGHRLVKITKQNTTNIKGSFIIPKKFLSILSVFLEGQSETNLVISGNYVFTNNNKDVFYSKIIDEKYPNYNAVIPEENPLQLIASKTEMMNNIKAASIATNKNTNQISLHLKEGKVYFKSVNQPESKTVHAPLKSAKYSGDETSIGFNAIYLKEAVSKYPNEEIIFTFKDSLSATLFLPKVSDQKTTILLMPVRINE